MNCCNCAGYHEQNLDWLIKTIKEAIEKIDSDYAEIYAYINEHDALTLNQSKTYTDSKFNALQTQINNNLAYVNEQMVLLYQYVDNSNTDVKAWVLCELAELESKIPKGNSIAVINPISGLIDSLQNTLNSLFDFFSINAFTCGEYASLQLTCEEYYNQQITCEQYVLYGKKLLKRDYNLYMVHPITGKFTFYKNVIEFLVSLHQENALTCSEYAIKDLTCQEYANFDLTCYDYNWNSKNLIN